jgi:hypothetical protein
MTARTRDITVSALKNNLTTSSQHLHNTFTTPSLIYTLYVLLIKMMFQDVANVNYSWCCDERLRSTEISIEPNNCRK